MSKRLEDYSIVRKTLAMQIYPGISAEQAVRKLCSEVRLMKKARLMKKHILTEKDRDDILKHLSIVETDK